jgi:hypothetical protein
MVGKRLTFNVPFFVGDFMRKPTKILREKIPIERVLQT